MAPPWRLGDTITGMVVVVLGGAGLGNRHVELVRHPALDPPEHAPLLLERMVIANVQGESQNADGHEAPRARHHVGL